MMKSMVLVASMFLGACASQTGWSPTVDTYGDPRAQYISADQAECRQLALQASGGTAQNAVTGTVVGGLLGAAAGAAIGAAAGNPGKGAAIGAARGWDRWRHLRRGALGAGLSVRVPDLHARAGT